MNLFMPWEHLETGRVNSLPLDLYRSGDEFMIRVDGLELMNSHWPRSEAAMAKIASESVRATPANILIGGLGLGFTLAAVLDAFAPPNEITVAEQSADVLRWYNAYFRTRTIGARDDARVNFVNQDVCSVIENEPSGFDLILLDVDNGPEPVSGEENATIYSVEGLRLMRAHIRAEGALLIWSAFESPEFLWKAKSAGYEVKTFPVDVGHRNEQHYILVLNAIS